MKGSEEIGSRIKLIKGNIALLDVDAIVNAANKSLILGGGVAGAIRSLGGPSIQEECDQIGPIKVGEAVITHGGRLKARHVIHAAGPVYGEGDEEQKLERATINSLTIAYKLKFKDIAFPAISTGIFHFPLKRCSEIMLASSFHFVSTHKYPLEIYYCLFDTAALNVFESTFEDLLKMRLLET
ncbi:MAG: macro domain-containing protein [Candidatus Aminicenantes bacterium]|nr:macro domain-containing protein [Candidatus Aminicenantes bacterium]